MIYHPTITNNDNTRPNTSLITLVTPELRLDIVSNNLMTLVVKQLHILQQLIPQKMEWHNSLHWHIPPYYKSWSTYKIYFLSTVDMYNIHACR
ncbi:MAG: hypothetical protein IPO92_24100 [Saprospiraceae bacterium]|nr:hypothetical protein [Saprospiraceae bacterium]